MKYGLMVVRGILMSLVILVGTTCLAIAADPADQLIQMLKSSDEDVEEDAEQMLVKMGSLAVNSLIRALKDDDRGVRMAAARVLAQIGAPAVDALVLALRDKDWHVKTEAARALGMIQDKGTVGILIETLRDDHQAVRVAAASALGEIGDPAAVEPLISALNDEQKVVRAAAARGLGQIGDDRAVHPLIQALGDTERVRRDVITALSAIGVPAVDALGTRLIDEREKPIIRTAIAEALGKIRAAEGVEPLSAALQDKDLEVRQAAAAALVAIGPPAVASVREVLSNNADPNVRVFAADVLGDASHEASRPWAQEALDGLILALGDNNPGARAAVTKNIEKFAYQAVAKLIATLNDNRPQVRVEAATTLAAIDHPMAIAPLEELLKTESDARVREAVESALAKLRKKQK